MAPSLTQGLAALLARKPITDSDFEVAALFTLDAVANAIGGRATEQGRILLNWATGRAMDPGREAFLMGALTHILEVDDLHKASVVHPGCVVVPAAWALGMSRKAHGHEVLKAVLWGFEATTRVGMSVGPGHYKVWHNTATCGPFGSAGAAAALLRLDEAATTHALGNAGTQSAGLWEFLETGAMSKHLHAGRGAEAGIVAGELAALGFTGPPDILEGPRGFYAGTCPDPQPSKVLGEPDHRWQVHETSIKPWPSCRHTHPAIDAARHLRERIGNREITSVRLKTYQAALDLCDRPEPDSLYAAKFSLQHCIAAALSHDNVSFECFDEAARRELSSLRAKIEVVQDDEVQAAYPDHWGSMLEVELGDGEMLTEAKLDALGDPELPLCRDQMIAKAMMLMRHGGMTEPAPLIDSILALADDAPLPRLGIGGL